MGESAKSSTTFDEKTEALGKASAGAKDKQERNPRLDKPRGFGGIVELELQVAISEF